ncbi:MAG: SRPBCC domain-containing protein [Bacteroidetes bacterium]|nr:SRPBCC domain-containing protein [Bacteroidota bacterium]
MPSPIVIQRTYKASAKRIWQAITDPKEMNIWWDIPAGTAFEPTPGFVARFVTHYNGIDFKHVFTVKEAIPNKKLSYDWRFEGYPGNSNVTFELEPAADGATSLTLTHTGLETFEGDRFPELAIKNFEGGWTSLIGGSLQKFVEAAH